ncbi:MAG: hypothetical protein ACI837_002055 [Crocinitomicaceae bacterium]|jgi:hypothetical protein
MKAIAAFILLVSLSTSGWSQGLSIENAMDSLYATVSPQLLVLGEDHTKDNTRHYVRVIRHLYTTQNVRTVAWEFGKSFQKLMNDYLLYGNPSIFKEFKKGRMYNEKDHVQLLVEIRKLNETLAKDDPIKIVCFDIEHDTRAKVFIPLRRFLSSFEDLNVPELDSIIRTRPYLEFESQEACVNILMNILTNRREYTQIFGEHYQDLIDLVEGSHFEALYPNDPDTVTHKRELFMGRMISGWFKDHESENLVMICGADHGSLLEGDSWLSTPSSVICNLKNELNISIYSFRTMYYNTRKGLLSSLFDDEIDYVKLDLEEEFLMGGYEDYLLFLTEEIDSSEVISDRYDGIFMKNCHGKRK